MIETLAPILKVSLAIFIAGSLLEMGLGLKLGAAMSGLQSRRFVTYGILLGFAVGPILAWILTMLIPMQEPYIIGLILLSMTPCAPFFPMMVTRAHGGMNYAAALMLLTAVGTVTFLPLAVPYLIPGLTTDAWTIARPLLEFVLLPLSVGMLIFWIWPSFASKLRPVVKTATAITAVATLLLCAIVYGRGFIDALGSYAIVAQVLLFGGVTVASYVISGDLPQEQRSVLGLGMSTRNVGAALAPLYSAAAVDQRAIVMVVLGIPVQVVVALLAARWFARRAPMREGS